MNFWEWFDELEDEFLDLSCVKDTKIEEAYFILYRLKNSILDVIWYGPISFLHNIILYRKFLWKNRWWDYYYLLDILQLKLEIDAKYYRKLGMSMESKKMAEEMENCAALINRIKEDTNDKERSKDALTLFEYIGRRIFWWWD